MKILICITYYRPHTSGLTIYAERLARAFAKRGHEVTVLTSQYDKELPREEFLDGVRIIRIPVLFRISKGVIMPSFGLMANKYVLESDVIQLHLPQFDAAGVALRGKILKKPTVITYHCDLKMPEGLLSWLANQAVVMMNHLAALFTHRIVTYTNDYAKNSTFLSNYLDKVNVILPPVELPDVNDRNIQIFNDKWNQDERKPVIGMAARFATEKGVEILLDALPVILNKYPDAKVQFAGPYENIIGEESYYKKLLPTINTYIKDNHWQFLGVLDPEEMSSFYKNIDVLVIPSLNSTEAFGLVQIEAMMNGKPSIASNLPGVRQPVKMHKMGEVVPIGNAEKLGEAVVKVLSNQQKYISDSGMISKNYEPDMIAERYEDLFNDIKTKL